MTHVAPPADLADLVAECWSQAFPGRTIPPRREYAHGGTHHVVLLGDDRYWAAMLRWNESPCPSMEAERLRYLLQHNPPVAMPVPVAVVQLERPRPFDRCEVQLPVTGEPLYRFLERRFEPEVQRSLGRQLGEFVAWLNAVPRDGALVPAEDPQSRDLLEHADACLERLERAGLRPAPARDLFDRLCELWQTRPQRVVCHNDVYPQHVLVGDDLRLGVVDWDDISVNEPIKDFTMWYEPFEGGFVFQDAYAEAFQAACTAYRAGFPAPDEERRLKLHALAGELSYDHDPEGVHVADWLARYGTDFGLRQTGF